ncbi:hypothetical protein ACFXTI_014607 [Malus domestica]
MIGRPKTNQDQNPSKTRALDDSSHFTSGITRNQLIQLCTHTAHKDSAANHHLKKTKAQIPKPPPHVVLPATLRSDSVNSSSSASQNTGCEPASGSL